MMIGNTVLNRTMVRFLARGINKNKYNTYLNRGSEDIQSI